MLTRSLSSHDPDLLTTANIRNLLVEHASRDHIAHPKDGKKDREGKSKATHHSTSWNVTGLHRYFAGNSQLPFGNHISESQRKQGRARNKQNGGVWKRAVAPIALDHRKDTTKLAATTRHRGGVAPCRRCRDAKDGIEKESQPGAAGRPRVVASTRQP